MVDASATALRHADLAARTVSIKIKFADFTLITRSHSMDTPIDATPAIGAVAAALLDSVDLNQGVRLLGVSLSGFGDHQVGLQLSLDLGPSGEDRTACRPVRESDRTLCSVPTRKPSGSSSRGER